MKNKFLKIIILSLLNILISINANSEDQFNFDVTEIEILEKGNLIKGLKKGKITTDKNVIINANSFVYKKKENILEAYGKVKIIDNDRNITIFSDNITYLKNNERIITNGNSKAINNQGITITSKTFDYRKNENILNAREEVEIENISENYKIFSEDITYFKNDEKIFSKGETEAFIDSKYEIKSNNINFNINKNLINSKNKAEIKDGNSQYYSLDNFNYQIDNEILKGENILIVTNFNLPESDKYYFSSAIIDMKRQKFTGKDTKIEIHKSIFNNPENDPRLVGVSSSGNKNLTTINKGVFTSCKKRENGKCPPWSISANQIKHDNQKKQIIYKDAFLNVYDLPVLYFPKFFHPDPSVKRQSGLLKPELNNSDVLGGSITLPYFNVISDSKDATITPILFDGKTISLQSEYRQANKYSNLIADFGYVKNYESSSSTEKKNLSHLFIDYDLDLNLNDYNSSNLNFSLEKVTNDTYLKVFEQYVTKSQVRPSDFNNLNSKVALYLEHENFNFETKLEAYENLQLNKSDRFQYILPYYNFDKLLAQNFFDGTVKFNSNGSNKITETNKVASNVVNNLTLKSKNFITSFGFDNSYGVKLKNLNSVGKNSSNYKSSPQVELMSIFNFDSNLPLINNNNDSTKILKPKVSFRFNPSDMKNYSTSENKIDISNIFNTNRFGFSDTFEAGRSLTLGLDFKRESKNELRDINNYFEIKLATVLRDKEENFIPSKSTLNRKSSNLFGLVTNKFSDNFKLNYNFAIDNDLSTFEYNNINATFSINNLITKFNFIEENGEMGDSNVFENTISYNIDDNNLISFNTRRNRKLNLTEYYDLVYEYKNDCLTAGIKYKKTYYEDRDLKPSEDLLLTITLFPLTTYEYEVEQ